MILKQVISALVAGILGLGAAAYATTAKDDTCNRAATAERERCQKRINPIARPVDPKNPTEAEHKAMDKHEKSWKACSARAESRRTNCRF